MFGRSFKNPLILVGLFLLLIIVFGVILIPMLSPYQWSDVDGTMKYQAPSSEHWFGTTRLGQDLFVNIWQGGRISLTLALIGVIPYTIIGTLLGILSGAGNQRVDFVVSQFMTFIHAFPLLPLIMILGIGLRQIEMEPFQILFLSVFIYSIFSTPSLFKVIRAETMRIHSEEYMKATNILGLNRWAKTKNHIFPNLASYVIVSSLQFMAHILIVELLLFFIGVGYSTSANQSRPPSWGNLIPNIRGDNAFKEYYWTWFFPISTIALTTVSLRLLSEGLRVAFDPKAERAN